MASAPDKPAIDVVAGVLRRPAGDVLLARRKPGGELGGLWEFPGGKLEHDETPEEGLERELREELGIRVLAAQPLIRVSHAYEAFEVRLHVHKVLAWEGEPEPLEQQPLRWVPEAQLAHWPMPAADQPVLKALALPEHYLITPPHLDHADSVLRGLDVALLAGMRLVQLRLPAMAAGDLREGARSALRLARQHGARLLLNGDPALALELGVDGIHLRSEQLQSGPPDDLPDGFWVGASCHDAEELARALAVGCDFACLSPVKPTRSHPQARALGWKRFRELAGGAGLPVYALGGLEPADADQARANGGQGTAGITGFWPGL